MTQKTKWTVWATVVLFSCLIFVSDIAGTQAKNNGTPNDETISGNPPDTNHELVKDPEEGKIEVEKSAPPAAHKKKFPWLVVAGVVVVAAVVFYFVVINKKYSLNVTLGEGVQGTPAAGNTKVKKGETVAYSFTLSPGYKDLSVRLDGSPVSASGTVKMDRNHTLEATSTKTAAINVTSTPPGAQIWMDGVKTDHLTPYIFYFDVAGSHTVLLRKDGFKDFQALVQVTVGAETPVAGDMPPGHHEDFDVAASSLWKPQDPSMWSVAGGKYLFTGRKLIATTNTLNYSWSDSSYTFSVRFSRAQGRSEIGTLFVLTTDPALLPELKGYSLYVTHEGEFHISRLNRYNVETNMGTWDWIVPWSNSSAILRGLNKWNTVRIVKAGSNYSFFINDVNVGHFTDTLHDPRYVVLVPATVDIQTVENFDYCYVNLGAAAAGSAPAEPVKTTPANGSHFLYRD